MDKQREIKFRAYSKDHGRFVYLELNNPDENLFGRHGMLQNEVFEPWQQYTGLKDKNGSEIFQGDILRIQADKDGYGSTSYEGHAEVTAQTCGYGFRLFNPSQKQMDEQGIPWDSSSLWHIEDENGNWVEIIGNKFENPELLK